MPDTSVIASSIIIANPQIRYSGKFKIHDWTTQVLVKIEALEESVRKSGNSSIPIPAGKYWYVGISYIAEMVVEN